MKIADIQAELVDEFEIFDDWMARYEHVIDCLLYTSPSPRDRQKTRMPSSA